tara:strand:- start:1260 stop:2732 length:1473 start_codon:yes stop_codon:yes gene_type:complete
MSLIYLLGGVAIATLLNKKKDKTTSNTNWESLANTAQGQVSDLEVETASLRLYLEDIQNELANNNSLNAELISQLQGMISGANLDIDNLTLSLSDAIDNQDDGLTPYSQDDITLLENMSAEAVELKQVAESALADALIVNTSLNEQLGGFEAALEEKQQDLQEAIDADALTPFGQTDFDELELQYNTSLEGKQSELDTALLSQDDGLTPYSQTDFDELELEYDTSLESKQNQVDDLTLSNTTLTQGYEFTISGLENDVQQLNLAVQEKIGQIDNLESANGDYGIDIDTLEQQVLQLQNVLEVKEVDLQNAIANEDDGLTPYGQSDIDSLNLDIDEKEGSIINLETELSSTEDAYNQSQLSLTQLQGSMLETLLNVEGLELNLADREEQIQVLSNTLSDVQENLTMATEYLEDANLELIQKSAALEEASNDFSILDDAYDLLVLEVADLQTEVNLLDVDKLQLETQVGDLNDLLDAYADDTSVGTFSSKGD